MLKVFVSFIKSAQFIRSVLCCKCLL